MSKENYLNPFDDETANFYVLKNANEQYSLWPVFATIPQGWESIFGPTQRDACLTFIEENWTSINPFATAEGEAQ
ncbi:MAG: MbtH family protein [Cellvibrio sp.]